jgi:hypothetical protein
MIPVQVAVAKALNFYESLPSKGKPAEVLVEEVKYSEKDVCFYVTIGYNVVDSTGGGKNPLIGGSTQYRREYKILKFGPVSGEVKSMKIRKI